MLINSTTIYLHFKTFQMDESTQKSIILNYVYGIINFCEIRKIKYVELPNDKIELFYNSPENLFFIGYYFGKYVEMQIN